MVNSRSPVVNCGRLHPNTIFGNITKGFAHRQRHGEKSPKLCDNSVWHISKSLSSKQGLTHYTVLS